MMSKPTFIVATREGTILATDGHFYHPDMLGPGHRLGAKTWLTFKGAQHAAQKFPGVGAGAFPHSKLDVPRDAAHIDDADTRPILTEAEIQAEKDARSLREIHSRGRLLAEQALRAYFIPNRGGILAEMMPSAVSRLGTAVRLIAGGVDRGRIALATDDETAAAADCIGVAFNKTPGDDGQHLLAAVSVQLAEVGNILINSDDAIPF